MRETLCTQNSKYPITEGDLRQGVVTMDYRQQNVYD